MTMTLVETITLASSAASIEFTSIPQDGTDLLVLISTRSDAAFTSSTTYYQFNGSTTGYSGRNLNGTGSSASSFTRTNQEVPQVGNSATASTFGNGMVYIPNYTSATNKSSSVDGVGENNATAANQSIGAYLWSNTAAITSIKLLPNTGNYAAGSTASLYKITKA